MSGSSACKHRVSVAVETRSGVDQGRGNAVFGEESTQFLEVRVTDGGRRDELAGTHRVGYPNEIGLIADPKDSAVEVAFSGGETPVASRPMRDTYPRRATVLGGVALWFLSMK